MDSTASLRADARTISVVALGHSASHFFQLLLPPLFPWLASDFGLSYAELGGLMAVFYVVSGVGQALSGFIVDRIGARPVLFASVALFVLASLAAAGATGYAGLALAATLAGLGNAPIHPVDFSILNKRVSPSRLGHAYSVHGITGSLGWAVATAFFAGIAGLTGSWRMSCIAAAILSAIVLAVLWWHRDVLDDRAGVAHPQGAARPAGASRAEAGGFAFLKLPSVWLCFSFFLFTTFTLSAIQSFAVPALQQLESLSLAVATAAVTGFMLCSAVGMVVGGFVVQRSHRLEVNIGIALGLCAAMLFVVTSGAVHGVLAVALVALSGFGMGLAGPSRDMLIRQAAPPGATGRVYGTVYSGLDIGMAIAPLLFGLMMDHGRPAMVFAGAGVALALAVATSALVGRRIAAQRRLAAA